jgi:2-polyprenyl-3-methyl-5-hydroxy-6-metoxy-1,4-benzoquinol methylase
METKEELHKYWKNPDADNDPLSYLDNETTLLRSKYLHKIVSKYFGIDVKVLEIGSNVGRNMNYLFSKGYKNLTGIEITETAVEIMSQRYRDCYENMVIINRPIEDVIKSFPDNEFDLVFTMAVLEHIPKESEWIFKEIERISKNILTIEDERNSTWRHCPRNYKKIFTQLKQLEHERCSHAEGFYQGFKMRLFTNEK